MTCKVGVWGFLFGTEGSGVRGMTPQVKALAAQALVPQVLPQGAPIEKAGEEAGVSTMAVFPWCSVLCPQPRFRSFLNMVFLFMVKTCSFQSYQSKESCRRF